MLSRAWLRSGVAVATVATFVAGCRVFDLIGLSKPRPDTDPAPPGLYTPEGQPILVIYVADTALALGTSESVRGDIYVSPITRFSKPYDTIADSARTMVSSNANVVSADGAAIIARSAGTATITMTGRYGVYPLEASATITVHP